MLIEETIQKMLELKRDREVELPGGNARYERYGVGFRKKKGPRHRRNPLILLPKL